MDLQKFSIIFLFVFVASTYRMLVSARLQAEGIRGYCAREDTFTKIDESVDRSMRQKYGRLPNIYKMECGRNYTSAPGVIFKETNVPFENAGEPDNCLINIQAPDGQQVYVYYYSYKFTVKDNEGCIYDKSRAAGLTRFYDGNLDTLLYSASRYRHDIRTISTGSDLLVDVVQSGKDCWPVRDDEKIPSLRNVKECYSELTKYQKIIIKYAFVKRDESGKVILLDGKKNQS